MSAVLRPDPRPTGSGPAVLPRRTRKPRRRAAWALPKHGQPPHHAPPSEQHLARHRSGHADVPVAGAEGGVWAAWNVRAHVRHATLRTAGLVAVDGAAVAVLHAALHATHRAVAAHWAGARWAAWSAASDAGASGAGALPLVVAVFAVLLAAGCYGGADRWRSGSRAGRAGLGVAVLLSWPHVWGADDAFGACAAAAVGLALAAPVTLALWGGRQLLDAALQLCVAWGLVRLPTGRVLLVGPRSACVRWIADDDWARRQAVTFVGALHSDETPLEGPQGLETVLGSVVRAHHADTVLLVGGVSDGELSTVLRAATMLGCPVLAPSRAYDTAGARPEIEWRQGQPFVSFRPVGLRASQTALKRLLDLAVAVPMLVLLSPLMGALALAVRLGDGGPAVFGQERLGRHGRRFRCYKFRSMYRDAELRLHRDPALYQAYVDNDYKLPPDQDPRVTPLGRFLRRTSLDELPQLWNVARGQMSLVGPRPIVPAEIGHYQEQGLLLLALKPGVTGLWQVSGRSALPYPARTRVELEYVDRWSVSLDLSILARTVPAVLAQRGAH